MINDESGPKIQIETEIRSGSAIQVSLDIRLTDDVGRPVGYGSLGSFNEEEMVLLSKETTFVTFAFSAKDLAEGIYYLSMDLSQPDVEYFDRVDSCLSFEIVRSPTSGAKRVLHQNWGYGSYELSLKRL